MNRKAYADQKAQFGRARRRTLTALASTLVSVVTIAGISVARAEQADKNNGYEIETEHIFGFTEGSDIGDAGEKSIEVQSNTGIGKGSGRYFASSNELQFKYTATDNFRIGVSPNFSYHGISGAPNLDDRTQLAFQGFSSELRYRLLNRGTAPVGLTFSLEPEWARVDDVSGEAVRHYGLGASVLIDKELVENRTFAALNLTYEPSWTRVNATGMWENESTLGVSAAITQQIISGGALGGNDHFPHVLLGAETRYLRAYDGAALNSYTGNALFAGPTLCVVFSKHMHLTFAWNVQLVGKAANELGSLDLTNFDQNRFRAIFERAF